MLRELRWRNEFNTVENAVFYSIPDAGWLIHMQRHRGHEANGENGFIMCAWNLKHFSEAEARQLVVSAIEATTVGYEIEVMA
jgi:hypothetical protein